MAGKKRFTFSKGITMSLGTCFVLLLTVPPASFARVARIEITERVPFADGMVFGEVGAYEKIKGKLHYAVDPKSRHNTQVVDLRLASKGRLRKDMSKIEGNRIKESVGGDARNAAGEVVFSGDFILLKPVDLSKGNHRLLYGVNNRGRPLMLGYYNDAPFNNDPSTKEHAGNGWLMRQGYSLLWSAWNWDVERVGEKPLRINLPISVKDNGDPVTGLVAAELAVQNRDGKKVERIAWGGSRCYPVAGAYENEAILTVRDHPDIDNIGPRTLIPRDQWDFAVLDSKEDPVYDPVHVYLPAGFKKGKIYELIYTAKNPRVVGLGLAAVRDAISFFRFDSMDDKGASNPLLHNGHPDPEYAYIFGISQPGRFIIQMIYQGFHVDEKDRMVFEGARPQVGGGGKGDFNYRFSQTTHHPKHLQGNYFPADHFPFNFTKEGVEQYDPLGQENRKHGDLLAIAKRLGKIPKIMICNHGHEYWTRAASLVHTNVLGTADATLHKNGRLYMINGASHIHATVGSRRTVSTTRHSVGYIDQRPVGRSLQVALDEWVTYGIDPPDNLFPLICRGELITSEKHRDRFPKIPAYSFAGIQFPSLRHPGTMLRPPRVDYGPRWWTEGIQDHVPPQYFGPPYGARVPGYDSDGNGVGGIRLPDLSAPLGTYQAFNPRNENIGAPGFLKAFYASFWPFALTEKERLEKGDPRPSVEERYSNKTEYVKRVKTEAYKLRMQRFLLEEDEKRIVGFAEHLVWPPKPIDEPPFWELEKD